VAEDFLVTEKENLEKDCYGQGKLSKNSDYFCHHFKRKSDPA
jgi:hypothetical protein